MLIIKVGLNFIKICANSKISVAKAATAAVSLDLAFAPLEASPIMTP